MMIFFPEGQVFFLYEKSFILISFTVIVIMIMFFMVVIVIVFS